MGRIDWIPLAEIPPQLQDGRDVLLWTLEGAVVAFWDRYLDDDDNWVPDWATHAGDRPVAIFVAEIEAPDGYGPLPVYGSRIA